MGIMTRDQKGWCSTQLRKAMEKQNITPICFGYRPIIGRVNYTPEASVNKINLSKDIDAMITRPIGRGSLEEIIFRMNLLHRLERLGLLIINPPHSHRTISRQILLTNNLTRKRLTCPTHSRNRKPRRSTRMLPRTRWRRRSKTPLRIKRNRRYQNQRPRHRSKSLQNNIILPRRPLPARIHSSRRLRHPRFRNR